MLFQKNIVKKFLASLPEEQVTEAWRRYQAYFLDPAIQANIQQSKEEQFQEGFLRELFVKILGYTLNPSPNYNLITEQKNETNSKKADGAILLDGKVIGVIELKDHKTTDLSKIENQAFGYQSQHPESRLVIISNFEKLRLYIDKAIDCREWNLFTLNETDFKELFLCLAWSQVQKGVAIQMKSESVSAEDQITNALYKDYSQFKRVIFADILKQNPAPEGTDEREWQLLLFKKTQKLLDRLLFIFFAEDCGLLPPNSMVQIIDQWEKLKEMDEYRPFYERVKKYFGYMNTGFQGKKYEIFAYNGGLFKPDEILDSIKISDDVLVEYSRKLSAYDFESDVDVNILGHIFENSLSEIEEVTQQITHGEAPQTSKRKQDGVFYTPQYITKYIVENTVGRLCEEKKQSLGIVEQEYFSDHRRQLQTKKRLLEQLTQYREWLLQITILDPACGSGAFLNAALQFLIKEHKLIDEMETKITGSTIEFQGVENSILENNLFGVDINEESVEIAQLALWLRTAKPHRKLNTLNQNIKCGNSLISDPAIAGDKAFNWQEQFPQVFEKGGFDVVIGNPPYVNVETIPVKDKEYYKTAYQSFYKRSDMFALFVEKGLTALSKSDGRVAFIIPSIVLNNLSYQPLRDMFLDNNWLHEVSYVGGGVFADATVDTSILVFDKCGSKNITLRHAVDFLNPKISVVEAGYFKTFNNAISISESGSDAISDKLFKQDFMEVGKCFTVFQGIVTGNNDAFIFETEQDALEKGIEPELLHNLCHGRDIGKWETRSLDRKILYVDETTDLSLYPNAYQWLLSFKEKQDARNVGKSDVIVWNKLHRPRVKSELDIQEKILIQNTRNESLKIRLVATIDKQGVYASQGINFVIPKTEEYSIYYLLSLLNSMLMNYLFSKKFLNLAIKAEYIKQIRFPQLSKESQQPFITLADTMLTLNQQLQEKRSRFLRRLTENMEGLKVTGALQTFDELDFKGFVAELKKQKIKLTLVQQDEWEEYFNQYKAACNEISSQIATTDQEIDLKVYHLYGLTYDEVLTVDPDTSITDNVYNKL
jgi:type I restriction-modification system DNA methylase subunit